MGKGISKWLFRLLVVVGVPIMVIVAIVLQSLFSVQVTPIERTEPPEYHTTKTENVRYESMEVEPVVIKIADEKSSLSPKIDPEKVENLKEWAKELFEKGEPFDEFIALLTHEDRDVRMAAAKVLGELNPFETSSFEQIQLFWNDVRARKLDLKDLLCDALVDAVEKGEHTWLPSSIGSLHSRNEETYQLLAWASRTHELPEVRRSAMYGVLWNGASEELISQVLNERASDPSLLVRKAVLELRFQRFYYGH